MAQIQVDRMDYFVYKDVVYRVIEHTLGPENDIRAVVAKRVLFRMDGVWHECSGPVKGNDQTENFNPYASVEPCTIGPFAGHLYLAHDHVADKQKLFRNVGLAKDWLAKTNESLWYKTQDGRHVYMGEGFATIIPVEVTS